MTFETWALLPQFIDPHGSALVQVAILGLTVVAARPRFQTLANRGAGTMLVAAGVSVARLERAP